MYHFGTNIDFLIKTKTIKIMIDLIKNYENAKSSSIAFMKNGQIGAYINSLLEMNKYKRLIKAIIAN